MPSGDVRLAMVRAAIADNPAFMASDVELKRTGTSYTVDTVHELRAIYPNAQFVLMIGMDNLEIFHTWKSPEEILRMTEIAVMVRPGYKKENVKPELLEHVSFVEIPLLEISSTEIRRRTEQGLSIRYMVSESVKRIIKEEGLYKNA